MDLVDWLLLPNFFVSSLDVQEVVESSDTESWPNDVVCKSEHLGCIESCSFRVKDRSATNARWSFQRRPDGIFFARGRTVDNGICSVSWGHRTQTVRPASNSNKDGGNARPFILCDNVEGLGWSLVGGGNSHLTRDTQFSASLGNLGAVFLIRRRAHQNDNLQISKQVNYFGPWWLKVS